MIILKLYFFFLLIFTENLFSQVDTNLGNVDNYKTEKFEVAIFPLNSCFYFNKFKNFSLTRAEIDRAELELEHNLKALNVKLENQRKSILIHENLSNYYRQYFGYTDKNGDQILYINCLKKSTIDYGKHLWLTKFLVFKDGGSSFWQVKYNLTKGILFELRINGQA